MQSIKTDVLIIGGGLAGLRASIESAKSGLKTIVVSKSPVGIGSNSILAGGGISIARDAKDIENHIEETLKIGKFLNDRRLVTQLAYDGIHEIKFLQQIGVDLNYKPPLGYMVKRDPSSKMLGGQTLIKSLKREASRYENIDFIPNFFVYSILCEENKAYGVIGFTQDDQPAVILSNSTILATGGGAGIYKRNDNYKRILGDGYALALESGLSLVDMEFVQFYPFGTSEPGLPPRIIYPPFPESLKLIDSKGEDLQKKYAFKMDLNKMIITLRDRLTSIIYEEEKRGGAFLGYTMVPESFFDQYPLNLLPKKGFNYKEKALRISPLAHFFMGGIKIGPYAETEIEGLFASGEVAGGLHGANRMGGNALAECLVFGRKGGFSAAEYAKRKISKKASKINDQRFKKIFSKGEKAKKEIDLLKMKREIQELAWKSAGPLRNEEGMKEGLLSVEDMRNKLSGAKASSIRELIRKRELETGLIVLKAIITSSLERKESRGAFQRDDYPLEGGSKFLKRIILKQIDEEGNLKTSIMDLSDL